VTDRNVRRARGLGIIVLFGIVGCRHRVATAPVAESPCWSYVASSPLPPERVARRYMDAFEAVGLADPMWFVHADTAWALTHPVAPGDTSIGARYAARIVAFRRGDSTHFRQYVAELAGARTLASDSAGNRRLTDLCAEITRAAAIEPTAPAAPTGDETLSVWRLGTEPR